MFAALLLRFAAHDCTRVDYLMKQENVPMPLVTRVYFSPSQATHEFSKQMNVF